MTNPISDAIEPLRNDAIACARTRAGIETAKMIYQLEKAGYDINIAAPATVWNQLAQSYRNQMMQIVDYVSRFYDNYMVKVNADKVNKYIEQAGKNASEEYTLFIAKMTRKIGDCDSAELEGSHVWGYSILTVKKGDITERWKTRQIINVSSTGKLFNQWPSRKIK